MTEERIDADAKPVAGSQTTVGDAFDFLAGRSPLPPGADEAAHRSLCSSVLVAAINQLEVRRSGRPAIRERER